MTRPLLALLLLAACTDPFIPEGTVRVDPPPEYRAWWDQSRACIGKPEVRYFDEIEWFIAPELLRASDGTDAVALTIGERVYLYEPWAATPWVVQHELAHAINGIRGHPADPFLKCYLMPVPHRKGWV